MEFHIRFEDLFETCAAVLSRGLMLGQVYSIGTYHTATQSSPTWVVLGRTGISMYEGSDLYEAVHEFLRLEYMIPIGA